ncbi:MAG: hypothetical protein STHCBS139747_004145 [Sporothrix thermara]
MGTAEEAAAAQARGGEDDEALPAYNADQTGPPAYNAGEGPVSPGASIGSMILPSMLSPGEDVGGSSSSEAIKFAPDDVLPPVVLVLDGQAIYSISGASASSGASGPFSPTFTAGSTTTTTTTHHPLYEVNRGITNLTDATAVVAFARMEPRMKSPVPRSRHIYNLHHPPPSLMRSSTSAYPYYGCFIEPTGAPTRKRGPLGLKRRGLARVGPVSAVAADHWSVLPVDLYGWAELGHPPFVAGAAALWNVRQVSGGAVKWVDGDGKDVALEIGREDAAAAAASVTTTTGEAAATGQGRNDKKKTELPRLIVTTSLRREDMDTLVAVWCCRLWERSIYENRGQVVKTRTMPTAINGLKRFR